MRCDALLNALDSGFFFAQPAVQSTNRGFSGQSFRGSELKLALGQPKSSMASRGWSRGHKPSLAPSGVDGIAHTGIELESGPGDAGPGEYQSLSMRLGVSPKPSPDPSKKYY